MLSLVLKRLVAAIPVVLIVATVVFLLLRMAPGDPARVIAGERGERRDHRADPHQPGLDRPLPVQYGIAMGSLVQGDLGTSIVSKQPVALALDRRAHRPDRRARAHVAAAHRADRHPAGRAVGLVASTHLRPPDDGADGAGLLGAGLRGGLRAHSAVLGHAQLVPGAGLRAAGRRRGALPVPAGAAEPDAARPCSSRSSRASRAPACSTCWARTSVAPRAPRAPPSATCCSATRCATRQRPSSPWSEWAVTTPDQRRGRDRDHLHILGVGSLIVDAVLARDYPVVQGQIDSLLVHLRCSCNLAIDLDLRAASTQRRPRHEMPAGLRPSPSRHPGLPPPPSRRRPAWCCTTA